jgi:hypothetical protein
MTERWLMLDHHYDYEQAILLPIGDKIPANCLAARSGQFVKTTTGATRINLG